MNSKRHILTLLVDNEPGVLSRVAGLFSGRGFNIESLCVAPTLDAGQSRITVTTKANPPLIEQIEKQLNKLINIIKVRDLSIDDAVQREMALFESRPHPKPGLKSCASSTSSAARWSMLERSSTPSKSPATRAKYGPCSDCSNPSASRRSPAPDRLPCAAAPNSRR
jgi:acetolactate synthase small subunit